MYIYKYIQQIYRNASKIFGKIVARALKYFVCNNLLMGEGDIAVKFFVEVDIKLAVAEFQKRV